MLIYVCLKYISMDYMWVGIHAVIVFPLTVGMKHGLETLHVDHFYACNLKITCSGISFALCTGTSRKIRV